MFGRRWIALTLSLGLAAPPAFGKDTTTLPQAPASGVIRHEFEINGKKGYFEVTEVPINAEAELVKTLAKRDRERFILNFASVDDPAFKAALESGQAHWINMYHMPSSKRMPLLASDRVSTSWKEKLLGGIDRVTNYFRSEGTKVGLKVSAEYGGVMSGFTMYTSGSVEAGVATFAAMFAWTAFMTTMPEKWKVVLNKGGVGHVGITKKVMSWFGKELNENDKEMIEKVGQFNTAWLASAAQVALLFHITGIDIFSLVGATTVFVNGFLNNYNVWDIVAFRLVEKKIWKHETLLRYFRYQARAGTIAEFFNNMGTPYIGTVMFGVVMSGLSAVLYGEALANKTVQWIDQTKESVGAKLSDRMGKARSLAYRVGHGCKSLLTPPKVTPSRMQVIAEDMW